MGTRNTSLAKITRPNPAGILPRERLFRRLDQTRAGPVIFIDAPPGAGKTSLVSSYIADRRLSCLWYQVDERDADAASFFYFMGLAARKAAPRYRRPLPLLTPEYGFGVATFARSYFETLYARLKPPCVLVFDNYQEIPSDSSVHDAIRIALSILPENLTAMIISRTGPPAALATLHAENRLHLIDWSDLKLTFEESRDIATIQKVGALSDELCRRLHETAGGWAAGLVLLVRALRAGSISPKGLKLLTPGNVFDYFGNELFDRLDPLQQDFLLKTAVVPKMTPALAERLTGNSAAAKILSHLNRRNYFTEKRTQPEVVYQYHALFREFLLTRAEKQFKPEEMARLRLDAARLLEASGQIEEAAELFLQAGAWKDLMPLIRAKAPVLISQGRRTMVEQWITAAPAVLRQSDPWVNYWLGTSRLASNPTESRVLFERAFELFAEVGDETGTFLAWSGAVQAYFYIFDEFSTLDRWIAWLDQKGGKDAAFPSPEIALIVAAGMIRALSWRNPVHPQMQDWVDKGFALARGSTDVETCARVFTNAAVHCIWKGMFDECRLLIGEMERMITDQAVSPLRALVMKHTEAMCYNALAEFKPQARQAVSEGLEMANGSGVFAINPLFYNQGVISSLNDAEVELAGEFLARLEKTLRPGSRAHAGNFHYLSACHFLQKRKVPQALAAAQKSLALAQETGVPVSEVLARLALVHALYESNALNEVERELAAAKQAILRTGSLYFEYLHGLAEASFQYALKNEDAGRACLRRALTLGRQQGYTTLLYFWRPQVMSRLCAKALAAGIETEYAQDLIRKLHLAPDLEALALENWPWPVKIHLLGGFQIFIDGKPVRFSGKVQKKPLLLLKALVALKDGEAQAEQLEDVLWPDVEGDVARRAFETTLHRLRKWIGYPDALRFSNGLAEMDRALCWTDVWAFERLVEEAGSEERRGRAERALELTGQAVILYKGALLPGDANEPWTVSPRERLRRRFLRCIIWLGRRREAAGEWQKAVACYQRGLEVDDICEEFYQRSMVCYQRMGRIAEALAVYERCRRVLPAVLGVKPSPNTLAVYRSLR